jgi:hypothetical protein
VRRLIAIFLLLLLPLQGFAMQGGWLSPGNGNNFAHELEHVEGTSHHHHDDGSTHYDESEESAQHFSEHSAFQQTAVLPSIGVQPTTIFLIAIAPIERWTYIPDPIPERPQRPPSLFLG